MIKILIADDHKIVRLGLLALFESEPNMSVVAQAEDGQDAVRKTATCHPDIAILDLMMPKMDGITAIAKLRETRPGIRIVALTSFSTSDMLIQAQNAGADAVVLKTDNDSIILKAIREISVGRKYLSPEVKGLLKSDPPLPSLSNRQQALLESMARGLSNTDISRQLGISTNMVREHSSALFAKLRAANRTEAVAIALRKHLLKI